MHAIFAVISVHKPFIPKQQPSTAPTKIEMQANSPFCLHLDFGITTDAPMASAGPIVCLNQNLVMNSTTILSRSEGLAIAPSR